MTKGIIGTCCGYGGDGKQSNYDCVQIPSASKAADKAILGGVAGFCGIFGLITVAAPGDTSATVCCKKTWKKSKIRSRFWLNGNKSLKNKKK